MILSQPFRKYSHKVGTSSPVRPSGPGPFGQFRNHFHRGDAFRFSRSGSLISVGNVRRNQNGEYTGGRF